jgi:uncharacterized protein YjiS (DUF1127 family)
MPPQRTNISPEIERDAAALRLAPPIALASDEAAGATAASTASVLSLLKRYWRAFRERRQNPQVSLQDLSDRELIDIGLTRGEIDYITSRRAIDALRDSTTHLWVLRGM